MMRIFALVLCAATLGACTYQANIAPQGAAAGEVMPGRRLAYPVSVYVEPELADLTREADTGYMCSAHAYPVKVGPAIVSTLRNVDEAAFARIVPGGTRSAMAPGAQRHLVFGLEEFRASLDFSPGFWTGKANAQAELTMKVTALGEGNREILRTVVTGEGSSRKEGDCPTGAQALTEAVNKAVKRAAEEYVFKVINAQQL